jgi:hypothetical protein
MPSGKTKFGYIKNHLAAPAYSVQSARWPCLSTLPCVWRSPLLTANTLAKAAPLG